MPSIQARGLTKRFSSDVLAVDHFDFDVAPGAVTGFLGLNGAGKTTTLRMLLGLVAPTSDSILIDGQAESHWERSRLSTKPGAIQTSDSSTPSLDHKTADSGKTLGTSVTIEGVRRGRWGD